MLRITTSVKIINKRRTYIGIKYYDYESARGRLETESQENIVTGGTMVMVVVHHTMAL